MDPQWDDMRVFLAVARESSLSGAGRVLKMDPATVGRRIARFEEALDTPLFVKSPQGYALSAAGDSACWAMPRRQSRRCGRAGGAGGAQ